jgi:hypothetical protein
VGHIQLATVFAFTALSGAAISAQDPVVTLPDAYKLQFENDWVKVVRVHLAPGVKLPLHGHPAALLAYVYLNDAEPVVFRHDRGPGTITRPAVKARSYRLSRGMVETHAIENSSSGASDYLRVEFKTQGSAPIRRRGAAPPLKSDNAADVEVTNDQMRITRVTIGAGKTMEVQTTAAEPALLIAVTDAHLTVARGSSMDVSLTVGQEHWIETRQREAITNTGKTAVEFLRFDFLSPPSAK